MAREMNPFAQRAADKQRSREQDSRRLQQGEASSVQLRVENSFFNLSRGVRILDFGRPPHRTR